MIFTLIDVSFKHIVLYYVLKGIGSVAEHYVALPNIRTILIELDSALVEILKAKFPGTIVLMEDALVR